MAWSSPNTVIPNLPGVSPHNIPIPLTPAGLGQPMQMQMYPQQQQGGYYLQAQPQVQMQMPYGQAYQPMAAAPFAQGYQQPAYAQNPYIMAGQPGMYSGHGRERGKAREDNPPLDKWLDGGAYGPVLDATTATILGVKLQINPILRHHSEQEDESRLSWDVLDTVKEAHLMHGSEAKAWKGRDASATFPRINRLILHSNHLPGAIEVVGTSKSGAVTCADVVAAIHEFVKEKLPRQVYESVNRSKRTKLDVMYHHNRSGKAGTPGPDFGTGIRKGDFLEEYTSFDGLGDNEEFVRLALGLGKKRKESTKESKKEEKTPGGKLKQRLWVGHLMLNLEHRGGEDVPVPEETDASESPQTPTNDLEDEDDEDEDGDYVQVKKGGYDNKPAKRRGKGNILYQQQQPQIYPPGMIPVQGGVMQGGMMYVPQGGYMPMQQPQQMMQQPIMPMAGYVPAVSPAMSAYQQQLPPQMQGNIQGYPNLGTPLQGRQRFHNA